MRNSNFTEFSAERPSSNHETTSSEKEVEKFARLLNDAQCELYPCCKKYSKLSFLIKMIYNKTITNSSNKSFSMNLELFKDALPEGETLPKSYYEVKKLMHDLGLGYITIDACVNDCILYWKEYEHLDTCLNPMCRAPRWKYGLGKCKKIAQKVVRYFPLKPRLQRLFMSKEIAKDMRWHKEKRVNNDVIRHPANAEAWKEFDKENDWFGRDPRNVRLGLASDGFNPFGNMSTSYSMWPVILLPYNLPPWKCMKEPFLFLSMLILGKDSPGNDIDVYLRPLIDELKELWENGVETFDSYSNENFQLHAALLWTINDFPAYGMLSGWSTKGKLACPLRHNLDVMHIEKNISETIIGMLLAIDGKTKDNVKTRLDLEEMGIRKELHLQRDGDRILMPLACYTLPLSERKKFCEWLKLIKLPDGYASNLSRCVNVDDCRLSGMKSHDYHVFLQRLLPAIAHGFLRKDLYIVLSELSFFFKDLCSKTMERDTLHKLQNDIALILCKLETIYPPSFFVIMTHLSIHLPREIELGGPVQYRWMYFVERFLCSLKQTVHNKARPEGSIAEAYINKECLNFCSMYFHGVETRHNRVERNFDRPQMSIPNGFLIFAQKARTLGATVYDMLSLSDFKKIQCLHKEELQRQSIANVQHRHQDEFPSWFKQYYSGIIVNGIRFHNIERDKYRHTQNSGIVVKGEHNSEEIDFYGELTDIIELEYCHGNCVYVFKCNWWNIDDKKNGSRTYGQLMSVNVNRKWYVDDPFVLQYEINDGNVIEQINNQDIESLHHDDEILEEIDATTILSRNSRKSSEDTISDDSTDEEDDTIIDYCVSDADDKEKDDNNKDNYDEEDDDDF
ncbi:uncharacterized protein LOC131172953 [Hevea brasiliensis]|uniref:uncharacterized protein LOC131172953 n=1 Tax=Hevea brasiliensis TaxID=3981 RepID=UPI0025D19312|nr:uncharacterized protein LOC131172953 [Hevea brasiliensis]